jgi:outer membrane murein-binding lipoprotein Lpp
MSTLGKTIGTGSLLAVALLLSGCGDSHDDVMKDSVAKMNEMTDVMKSVTDKASAHAAAPKLKQISTDMKSLKAREDKLGKPSDAEKKQLEEKYKKDLETAMGNFMKETFRVAMLGPDVQAELQDSMKSFEGLN